MVKIIKNIITQLNMVFFFLKIFYENKETSF